MKPMSIRLILLCALWAVPTFLMAKTQRNESQGIVHKDVDSRIWLVEQTQPWLESQNPTAIGLTTLPNMGITQIAGEHLAGDLHRQMESSAVNSWGFGANSYQALKHVNLWGDFSFAEKHHIGRAFSDNFAPYNGNPYQVGSSLKGNYTEQMFDFGVKLSSKRVWKRWWFGVGLDYAIGDLSRTQDPRSRVQFVDMTLTPGFVVEIKKRHKLGAHFSYRYRKEKNTPYISKSKDDKEYKLYLQEGLGVFQSVLSSSFDRRQKGNYYGGGLVYEFTNRDFKLFSQVDFVKRTDDIEDRKKQTPGDYADKSLTVQVKGLWLKETKRHALTMDFSWVKGDAQKAFQELVSETDPITGITTSHFETKFMSKSFTHDLMQLNVAWNLTHLRSKDYLWHIGVLAGFHSMKDKYVFYTPSSKMEVGTMTFGVEGGALLWSKARHRMTIEGAVNYYFNMKNNYFLSPDVDDQFIAQSVHSIDFWVMTSNMLDLGLKLKYFYPLSKKLDGFVSMDGRYLISTTDTAFKRGRCSLSLGFTRRF